MMNQEQITWMISAAILFTTILITMVRRVLRFLFSVSWNH